jgi:hypothetical protein
MTAKTWHFATIALLMITLAAGPAWGQAERVLHFAHTDGKQSMAEISTSIGTISEVRRSLDDSEGTLKVDGTPEQIALAEWLFVQLDQAQAPAANQWDSTVHEYLLKSGGENAVRVLFLRNTATVQNFQEVAVAIRSITEIRRAFTCSASRAITLRGTPDQIGLAAWIVDALDLPPGEKAASREYRMPMSSDRFGEVVTRISYVSNAETVQDFQEIAAAVRGLTEIRRTFAVNRSRAIVARSTAEALDLAQWMIQQIDKPAIGKPGAVTDLSSGVYEYTTRGVEDSVTKVRFNAESTTAKVFYLAQVSTLEDFQALASRIRSTANMRRTFTYNAARAVAVRGTVDQVETAERMAKGLDRSQ